MTLTRSTPWRLAALALLSACSTAAFAQERGSTTTIINDRGDTVVIDRDLARDGDTTTGVTTRAVNGADPGTREFTRTRDTETGVFTSNSTATSAGGAQSSSSRTTVCPPGSGSCTRDTVFTGPQGGVTTTSSSATRSEDGSVNGTSSTTRPNGEVVTKTLTSSGEPGDRSGTVVREGPEGTTTRDFTRAGSREDGYNRTNTVTLPNGGVATSEASGDCGGGACNRSVTRTGPQGRSETVEGQTTRISKGQYEQTQTRTNNQTGESKSRSRTATVERRRR